tara:strand:+ start:10248 stop:11444 length:1197 start_codon:yes stop_codon:yes gene_type:complete
MKNKNEVTAGEHLPAVQEIVLFSEFDQQLAEVKKKAELVFDLTDPKQEAACRSEIHSIRGIKGSLEASKKDLKQDVLERGRAIDGEYNRIKGELDGVIDVLKAPLDERQVQEDARISIHSDTLKRLRELSEVPLIPGANFTSGAASELLKELNEVDLTTLEEFQAEGQLIFDHAEAVLVAFKAKLEKAEQDAVELEQLQAEKVERDAQAREDQIREEAAETAKQLILNAQEKVYSKLLAIDAELADDADKMTCTMIAMRTGDIEGYLQPQVDWPRFAELNLFWVEISGKLVQARKDAEDLEAKQQEENRIQEQQDQVDREAAIKKQAQVDAEDLLKEQKKQEKAAADKREANKKHKAKVDAQAVADLCAAVSDDSANIFGRVIEAISEGKITGVFLEY